MMQFPFGESLAEERLRLTLELPLKPASTNLDGIFVRLLPLDLGSDLEELYEVSSGQPVSIGNRQIDAYDPDELIWRYMFKGPFASANELGVFLREIDTSANMRPFCAHDVETGRRVGIAAYTNNTPEHLKIELGHIWYSPLVQRTKANLESTYLLLRHAFELGYRRVEWKCDALNERSRRSALRMGFKFEGIQEAHFIIKGRNRDTAWFRMLDSEWPEVRRRLESMLYA